MLKELKVIAFAAGVCLVCSLLLSAVYSGLKDEYERNKALDVKIKVLEALGEGIFDAKGRLTCSSAEAESLFDERVEGLVLNSDGQTVNTNITELTDAQISAEKEYYPLYVYTKPDTGEKRYAIHISGKGLWSTVKGYMAFDDDLSTIIGLAFYEQQETAGLGGEIESPTFKKGFIGKKFIEDGTVQTFRIVKPGTPLDEHSVDGITAATLTCSRVAIFINSDFAVYNKYFETLRK